jgi:hypothetical protein
MSGSLYRLYYTLEVYLGFVYGGTIITGVKWTEYYGYYARVRRGKTFPVGTENGTASIEHINGGPPLECGDGWSVPSLSRSAALYTNLQFNS